MEESINPMGDLPPVTQPTTPVVQATPPESVQPVERKSSKKLVIGILIGLGIFIALIASIFLIVGLTTKEPLQASNQFLAGFATNDAQALYSTTSTKFQNVVTSTDFETFFLKYKVLPFTEAKVTAKSIETQSSMTVATFTYSLKYNSETYEIEIEMIKQGEDWKLLSMQII